MTTKVDTRLHGNVNNSKINSLIFVPATVPIIQKIRLASGCLSLLSLIRSKTMSFETKLIIFML